MQQYADIYLLQRHSTCFGRHSAVISPEQTTLEGSNCNSIMTYTRGSGYSF